MKRRELAAFALILLCFCFAMSGILAWFRAEVVESVERRQQDTQKKEAALVDTLRFDVRANRALLRANHLLLLNLQGEQ